MIKFRKLQNRCFNNRRALFNMAQQSREGMSLKFNVVSKLPLYFPLFLVNNNIPIRIQAELTFAALLLLQFHAPQAQTSAFAIADFPGSIFTAKLQTLGKTEQRI